MYCVRDDKKDGNWNYMFTSSFWYLEAADFLRSHPKLGGKYDYYGQHMVNQTIGFVHYK